MEVGPLFRRLVFAQLLLGIIGYAVAERNPGLMMIAAAFAALAWYMAEGGVGRPLPRAATNFGVLAGLLWLLFDLYRQGGDVLVAMCHFLIWLQVVMLASPKRNREYGQLLVVSLTLMVGATMIGGSSFLFALLWVAYALLAISAVLVFQLELMRERVANANRRAAPPGMRVAAPEAVFGRGVRWQFRVVTLATAAGVVVVSVPVFLFWPRSGEGGTLFADSRLGRRTSGFSERASMIGAPPQQGNPEAVMTLRLRVDGEPLSRPAERQWLLRGAALGRYDRRNRVWSRLRADMGTFDRQINLETGLARLVDLPDGAREITAEVARLATVERVLFTLQPVTGLASEHVSAVRFDPDTQRVVLPETRTGPIVYRFRTVLGERFNPLPQYHRAGRGEETDEEPAATLREWTVAAERIRRRAKRIIARAEAGTANQVRARALARHLREHYRYSLRNPPASGDTDPIVRFLFEHKRGHCELYAGALAAMARTIGIPARVVTGYRVSEYNDLGGYYVVRKGHAHAWTEIYDPSRGWMPVDATPPQAVDDEHAVARGWLAPFRSVYEYLEFAWLRVFVSYDEADQRAMTAGARKAAGRETSWFADTWRAVRHWIDELRLTRVTIGFIAFFGFFILLGIASLVRSLVVRRRRFAMLQLTRLPPQERRSLARQLRFYLTMLDMLERHGIVRPAWQSPFQFAERLHAEAPEKFEPVLALTDHFYEIRFGHRRLDETRTASVRAHLKRLERNLIHL